MTAGYSWAGQDSRALHKLTQATFTIHSLSMTIPQTAMMLDGPRTVHRFTLKTIDAIPIG